MSLKNIPISKLTELLNKCPGRKLVLTNNAIPVWEMMSSPDTFLRFVGSAKVIESYYTLLSADGKHITCIMNAGPVIQISYHEGKIGLSFIGVSHTLLKFDFVWVDK